MPKGPQGQKRPADVIGNAVHVMRIATGQIEETTAAKTGQPMTAAEMGRKGGKARAQKLSKKAKVSIAEKAAKARWNRNK